MSDFKINNITPITGNIKVGNTNVSKIYCGSTLVWPMGSTPIPPVADIYGYLYNSRIVDNINFPPTGWRVPTYFNLDGSEGDWLQLRTYLISAGWATNFAGVLKSTRTTPSAAPSWQAPNTGASDLYGFNCLPAGRRSSAGGFGALSIEGSLLMGGYSGSSSIPRPKIYGAISFTYNTGTWQSGATTSINNSGYSARFVKVDPGSWAPGDTVTDGDGNVYQTIKIGNQVWTTSNWKSTKYSNGESIQILQDPAAWAAATTGAASYYKL